MKDEKYLSIKVTVPKEDAFFVEEFFHKSGAKGSYEILYEENAPSNLFNDFTTLVFFFPINFPAKAFVPLAMATLSIENYSHEIQEIAYRDFEKEFQKHFKSFPIGKTWMIVPPWEKLPKEESTVHKRILFLKPGLAFGTGLHPTTQLMLEYLEEIMNPSILGKTPSRSFSPSSKITGMNPSVEKVVDYGCGSGILSVAAAILGAEVLGMDIDSLAIESALENLKLNKEYYTHLPAVKFQESNIFYQKADVALANIIPAVFYNNKEEVKKIITKTPVAALSGIYETQANEFETWLKEITDRPYFTRIKEGWFLYVFR